MEPLEQLIVSLDFGAHQMDVGELAHDAGRAYFKYYPEFLARGLNISPIKLPLQAGLLQMKENVFDGLFGVFNDSMPDGWGRLLLDRELASRGVNVRDITVLNRLSLLTDDAMGALRYRPKHAPSHIIDSVPELDLLAKETKAILTDADSDALDVLFQMGGSSGGARPKIFLGVNAETNQFCASGKYLPEGYEHWLVKFPSSFDKADIAHIEYAYYLMAKAAGIEMSDSRLFLGKSGKAYFGTKRFDRTPNANYHFHSASGLMHDNFRLSTMDYGHLMDAAFRLEKDVRAYEKVLRLAAFNVFTHNRDDHSKNFGFLMDDKGKWQLSPAYDLTYSNSSHGLHSTMVAGESKKPTEIHLMKLAEHFGVKRAESIIDEIKSSVTLWKTFASDAGVTKRSMDEIDGVIQDMIK